MKNFFKIFALVSFMSANFFHAQQVIKNDTINGTPLTVVMDQKVSDLLSDIEDKCATPNTFSGNENYDGSSTKSTTPKISVPERELTNAEICRRNPRIMGYKIQLAVVKSNDEAREVGMFFRRRFPNMKVEIDASLRPNYKVMAGSYFTKQSAASDLARIKQHFKSALPIQYRVFCVEAK
ncbi:SPOR domain-containing protein [Kaistella polysaccharea]|uniref:SPOR domain-containing protein n=1 Tax=Kaistella polysaccharea TaxID=2878534 RepID=UPI001CF5FADD|nr:SPOR domain-containing protein [Kaistella polysaccharea]